MTKLYLAAAVCNLCMLSYGISFAWAFPLLFTSETGNITLQYLWIKLSYYLGGITGSLCCMCLLNVFGRKCSLVLSTLAGMAGWMVIVFGAEQLLEVGRYIIGIGTSYGYITVIVYMGEISPANKRGMFTSWLIVAANIGMFIKWQINSELSIRSKILVSLASIFLISGIMKVPESPYYFMQKGKNLKAVMSLIELRQTTDVPAEAGIIEKSVKTDLASTKSLCGPGNRKALITVMSLMVIQQWCGQMILWNTFIFISNIYDVLLGITQIIFIFLVTFATDRFGRRSWLITSSLGITVATLLLGLYIFLRNNEIDTIEMPWLLTAGMLFYGLMYAFGLATLPFTMMSEVFPMNIKNIGSCISILSRDLSMCILQFLLPFITYGYGMHIMYWLFSIISLLGAVFVYLYTPETKGKTLAEVQDLLHKRTLF